MSDWYYSAGNEQRQGPLSTEELVGLFRHGRVGLDTLVWRDGQSQWQPLADFATELGLVGASGAPLPPPLPVRPAPSSTRVVAPPPKSGMSGCLIAAIIIAVLAIPAIAILAAIALPAYQQYVTRAKVASALPAAEPYKSAVATYLANEQACPSNGDTGFDTPEHYASGSVASITFGEFEGERCGMELRLTVPGDDKLDGKAVWLEYDPADASWQCTSEIDDRYLPASCRG